MNKPLLRESRAFTLIEVLTAASIGAVALTAVLSGAIAMQRCFVGAEDFATAKTDQARLSDYIALDLRRALTVTAGTDGSTLMTVQIPDYYDGAGKPKTPTITKYVANYGDPAKPVTVVYRKIGSSIFRQENAATSQEIAANVEDFQLTVQDLGKVVKTQVTFAPRFQHTATAAARTATTVFGTTLLRNQRRDR
jgi:prepilin-type N-terminal cleavage/methylation domain-containing protein